jgi:phosphohistidine phosphatase
MSETRRLYVLRHAKSSWDDPTTPDHDRPLAPRGRRAVKLLSRYIDENGIRPDLVLCSTARRALETLQGVSPGGETMIEPAIYAASADELLARLRRISPQMRSAMVVGHNPALQMLILRLAHGDTGGRGRTGEGLEDIRRKLPTGALATLSFDCEWSELELGSAELTDYVRPKALQYQ